MINRFHGGGSPMCGIGVSPTQPIAKAWRCLAAFGLLISSILPLHAATRTSANYSVLTEAVDSGGAKVSSTNYSVISEAGCLGQVIAGAGPTVARVGFIGQLFNLTGLVLNASGTTLDERGTAQISLLQILDDGTFLTLSGSSAVWSVASGAISGVDAGGVATAATVYQNTPATVRATYGGQSATLNLTVVNVNNDDYGIYANDGVNDYLEVNHLVAPQVNPVVMSLVTQRSVRAVSQINPNGLASLAHFEYGFITPHGISTLNVSLGSGSATLSTAVDLHGLLPHRTWRIRAVATNVSGTTASTDSIFRTLPKTDINRDGYPDLVAINPVTRATSILYTRAGVQLGGAALGPSIPANLAFCGMADFNGDAKTDWLLFDATAHRAWVWYQNTTTSWTKTAVTTLIPVGYDVITAVDTDGDGQCDLILFYKAGRRIYIMRMTGLRQLGALVAGPLLPVGFVPTAVDDLTGDGKLDYLVWNATTRQTAIVNGITSAVTYGTVTPVGQQLMGADAFKSGDAVNWVLYSPTTNLTTIWTMSGARMVATANGPKVPVGMKLMGVR